MRGLHARRGVVLIFSLWVLGILTILAVSVAAGVRQKIFLIARLDERSRMNYLLEAAVKKTAGYIHQQMEISSFAFTPMIKSNLLNNTRELTQLTLGGDHAQMGYVPVTGDNVNLRYGVVDEESKINLNKTDIPTLATLLKRVLSMKDEDAAKMALHLLDWRQSTESEINGFYSEDYYSNLQYPYPKKSADYESLDEILLVRGITKQIYEKIINYVTIYGDGDVNINTASPEVLAALGLADSLIDKIMIVRRGKDGLDATDDDHVFLQPYDIAAEINYFIKLNLDEMHAIDALNAKALLGTNSYYYTIEAIGHLSSKNTFNKVRAVYSSRTDKIIYWKEK